jgi:hypothetical protein
MSADGRSVVVWNLSVAEKDEEDKDDEDVVSEVADHTPVCLVDGLVRLTVAKVIGERRSSYSCKLSQHVPVNIMFNKLLERLQTNNAKMLRKYLRGLKLTIPSVQMTTGRPFNILGAEGAVSNFFLSTSNSNPPHHRLSFIVLSLETMSPSFMS